MARIFGLMAATSMLSGPGWNAGMFQPQASGTGYFDPDELRYRQERFKRRGENPNSRDPRKPPLSKKQKHARAKNKRAKKARAKNRRR